jgi:hypothetical protein
VFYTEEMEDGSLVDVPETTQSTGEYMHAACVAQRQWSRSEDSGPSPPTRRDLVRNRELSLLATAIVTAHRTNAPFEWEQELAELEMFSADEVAYLVNRIMETMEWTPEESSANAAELDEYYREAIAELEHEED